MINNMSVGTPDVVKTNCSGAPFTIIWNSFYGRKTNNLQHDLTHELMKGRAIWLGLWFNGLFDLTMLF